MSEADAGPQPSYEDLLQRARGGEPADLRALGLRLLTGEEAPLAPAEGAGLLAAAADRGDAEALHRTAVFAAAGVFRDQSWTEAVDCLRRAAEQGSRLARGELALLAGAPEPPPYAAKALWARLAKQVDVAAWLRPAVKTVLSDAPRVRTVQGFAPLRACDWLIDRARDRLKPARVYDLEKGGHGFEQARNNTEAEFDLLHTDVVLVLLQTRIAALTGLPLTQMERPTVLHYEVGQSFLPHYDFLDPAEQGIRAELARQGQRVATFLLYLNADFEGGETAFTRAGLSFRGRPGDAVYFANVDLAGRPDRLTMHAGQPPTRGEKWLLSQFIRGPAVDIPAG